MEVPKHIPQFDNLRAFAVLAVMLFHASHHVTSFPMGRWLKLGWIGVDLFFVLSGFLITGILIRSRREPHFFRNFYARRALRIWPLYYALLALIFWVLPLASPTLATAELKDTSSAWHFVFFVQNFGSIGSVALSTTWSLAIEEQFYLVWPFLVWWLPAKVIQAICIGVICLSPILRLVLAIHHPEINPYYNTVTHLDGLALGSFLAIWIPAAKPSTVKALALCTLAVALPMDFVFKAIWIRYTAFALTFAAVVALSFFVHAKSRFLRHTGRVSFGLYMIHMTVFGLVNKPAFRKHFPGGVLLSDLTYLFIGFAVSYLLASLSWKYFESRILTFKRRFEAVRRQAVLPHEGGQQPDAAIEAI